jgi:glutaredoxin
MNCPKCGYTRKSREPAPDTQCPSCGVYYAKVVESAVPVSRGIVPVPEARGFWSLGKILVTVAVVAGVASFASSDGLRRVLLKANAGGSSEVRDQDGRRLRDLDFSKASIVMYSLTTCTYCAALRRTFEANNVPFTEYFVDTDRGRNEEMFRKLQASGFNGGVGTPTLEVNGRMMPNNPPLADIIRQART